MRAALLAVRDLMVVRQLVTKRLLPTLNEKSLADFERTGRKCWESVARMRRCSDMSIPVTRAIQNSIIT
jgi:hypothetical protein